MLSLPKARVQSLVGELRSHKPLSSARNKQTKKSLLWVENILNDFTFCQNPGNHRLIILPAAQFLSCVFLFLYPFLWSLALFSTTLSWPSVPWSLPNPLRDHWSRTKERKWQYLQPFPITVSCLCRLAASLMLISSLAWLPSPKQCACPVPGLSGGLHVLTVKHRRREACWGRGWWMPGDLPPYIQTAAASWLSTAVLALGFSLGDVCLAVASHFSLGSFSMALLPLRSQLSTSHSTPWFSSALR